MSLAPVVAVVGPSGVGKDSVMEALAERDDRIRLVRRVITRPDGAEGEDFTRVGDVEFERMRLAGAFMLDWPAHGLRYGIPVAIAEQRKEARALLVNLSRSVLRQAQDIFGSFVVVSLTADPEVLARRLAVRGRETTSEQTRRLGRASLTLPEGLNRVIDVDNSGPLDRTVDTILTALQLERA